MHVSDELFDLDTQVSNQSCKMFSNMRCQIKHLLSLGIILTLSWVLSSKSEDKIIYSVIFLKQSIESYYKIKKQIN